MAEYSRMARGKFTSTGAAKAIFLPFQPDFVEFWNYTAAKTPANHGIPHAVWDAQMGQGFAVVELFNGTPVLTTGAVETNGVSTFYAGLDFQFGAAQQVVSITATNPPTVTVTGHGYSSGDVVLFSGLYQSSTTGMPQLSNIPFTITRVDANSFTINWDASGSAYTALSASPAGATVKKVLYPYLYAPGVAVISSITRGTTTTVVTTSAHNFVVGQEVAFRVPSQWGTIQLNSLPNSVIPGSPIYGYVISVTDYKTFVVNIDSSTYTAFTSNVAFNSLDPPAQVLAVGDVNSGGVQISSGSALYPPPYVVPFSTTRVNSINGPAVQGAFFNNTRQGFVIGAGATTGDASSVLVGANNDVIYWRALLHDMLVS